MKEAELFSKTTHISCVMCKTVMPVKQVGFTPASKDEVEDAYELTSCCDDPVLEALIISDVPLFADGDKAAPINDDYWNYGTDRYEYTLNDDFINEVEMEEDA